jgi:hypothetical protein
MPTTTTINLDEQGMATEAVEQLAGDGSVGRARAAVDRSDRESVGSARQAAAAAMTPPPLRIDARWFEQFRDQAGNIDAAKASATIEKLINDTVSAGGTAWKINKDSESNPRVELDRNMRDSQGQRWGTMTPAFDPTGTDYFELQMAPGTYPGAAAQAASTRDDSDGAQRSILRDVREALIALGKKAREADALVRSLQASRDDYKSVQEAIEAAMRPPREAAGPEEMPGAAARARANAVEPEKAAGLQEPLPSAEGAGAAEESRPQAGGTVAHAKAAHEASERALTQATRQVAAQASEKAAAEGAAKNAAASEGAAAAEGAGAAEAGALAAAGPVGLIAGAALAAKGAAGGGSGAPPANPAGPVPSSGEQPEPQQQQEEPASGDGEAKKVWEKVQKAAEYVEKAAHFMGEELRSVAGNDYMGAFEGAAGKAADAMEKIPVAGGAMAAATRAATAGITEFGSVVEAVTARGKELSQWNGVIAAASAQADIRGMFADLREANELQEPMANLLDSESRFSTEFREVMLPIKTLAVRLLSEVMEDLADALHVVKQVGFDISKVADILANLSILSNAVLIAWSSAQGKGPVQLIKDIMEDVKKIREGVEDPRDGSKRFTEEQLKAWLNETQPWALDARARL